MKKTILSTIIGILLATSAFAGDTPTVVIPPNTDNNYGFYLSKSFSYLYSGSTDEFAAGLSLGYTFNQYVGLQAGASFVFCDSSFQEYSLDSIWYVPSLNTKNFVFGVPVSPYLIAGFGALYDSGFEYSYRAGAGVNIDISKLINSSSIYVEGIWSFMADDLDGFGSVRTGLKYSF